MLKTSYSARIKEYLCERTCTETGFTKGGKDRKINKCCAEAFLCGSLLFSKKCFFEKNVLKLASDNFSELLIYILIQFIRIEPQAKNISIRDKEFFEIRLPEEYTKIYLNSAEKELDLSDLFHCAECSKYFLRGVFLSCGTVTDPQKSYHAEFLISDEKLAEALFSLLLVEGKDVGFTKRRNIYVIYIKGSERISDFFYEIGAGKYSLDIIEKSIEKEIKNNLNRSCNCENSNTRKTVSAFVEFKVAADKIKSKNAWNTLSEELREAAELRLRYPDASLTQLCLLYDKGNLSRSALNRRLRKITEIAKELD